jgi:hypothetical protein
MPRSGRVLQLLVQLALTTICCTAATAATSPSGTAVPTRQLRVDFGIAESYYDEAPAAPALYYAYSTPSTAAAAAAAGQPFVSRRTLLEEPTAAPAATAQKLAVGDDISQLAVPVSAPASSKTQGAHNVQLRWPSYDYIQQQLKQLEGSAAEEQQQQQQQGPKKFSVVIMNWSRPQNTKKIAETYATDPAYEPYVAEVIVLHLKPDAIFELNNAKVRNDRLKHQQAARRKACFI